MNISNWISVISIVVSLLIAISSWIYTAWTTWKNNRPNVVVSIRHYRLADSMSRYLVIKNFGKVTADIKNVTGKWLTDGNEKIDLSIWKDTTLAPGQDDTIYLPDGIDGKLNVEIEYFRHKKQNKRNKFKDTFTFNINKVFDLEFKIKGGNNEETFLAEIARTLQEMKK